MWGKWGRENKELPWLTVGRLTVDGTDLGQGRENIKSDFKQTWEFGAVYQRYLLDIQAEKSSKGLDAWVEFRRELFWR